MTLKRTGSTELEDAARLQALFYEWQSKQQAAGLPSSQAEAARILGFGQSAVSQYLNGAIPLNFRAASKFAELLRCSIRDISPTIAEQAVALTERVAAAKKHYETWIDETGRGVPVLRRSRNSGAPAPVRAPVQQSSLYPLIAWNQVADWLKVGPARAPSQWFGAPIDVSDRSFYLEIRGDSMHDPAAATAFREGEMVLLDPSVMPTHGAFVLVLAEDADEPIFRQLVVEGGKHYLKAINPSWPDRISVASDQTMVLATARSKVVIF